MADEEEWLLIEHHFRPEDNRGAVPRHAERDIVNAILYLNKTGAQWRTLPKSFPPGKTVYDHFSNWNRRGEWEVVLDQLNVVHRKNAKAETSTYAIIDSQSVKTVTSSEQRGFDGGKKTKGRKRHMVVDTLGNLIHVLVHAANIHDTKGGCAVLQAATEKCSTLRAFSGDEGYRGTAVELVENTLGLLVGELHDAALVADDDGDERVFEALGKQLFYVTLVADIDEGDDDAIDHVAARDQVQPGERWILGDAVVGEHHQLPQGLLPLRRILLQIAHAETHLADLVDGHAPLDAAHDGAVLVQ